MAFVRTLAVREERTAWIAHVARLELGRVGSYWRVLEVRSGRFELPGGVPGTDHAGVLRDQRLRVAGAQAARWPGLVRQRAGGDPKPAYLAYLKSPGSGWIMQLDTCDRYGTDGADTDRIQI